MCKGVPVTTGCSDESVKWEEGWFPTSWSHPSLRGAAIGHASTIFQNDLFCTRFSKFPDASMVANNHPSADIGQWPAVEHPTQHRRHSIRHGHLGKVHVNAAHTQPFIPTEDCIRWYTPSHFTLYRCINLSFFLRGFLQHSLSWPLLVRLSLSLFLFTQR